MSTGGRTATAAAGAAAISTAAAAYRRATQDKQKRTSYRRTVGHTNASIIAFDQDLRVVFDEFCRENATLVVAVATLFRVIVSALLRGSLNRKVR